MIALIKRLLIMKQKYLPIDTVSILNEVEPIEIMNLYYKNKEDERFKVIDGNVFVIENYKYPLADELNKLREKALIIASNENRLCKELSEMSGIDYDTLRKYFYRFTFKQMSKAKQVLNLLKLYVKNNSLFTEEELTYD
jgi:hypothetical protein